MRRRRIIRNAIERLEQRTLLAAVAWTGFGDGVNWTDPSNWSSAPQLPGPADDVTISVAANPMIQLNSGTQLVHSLIDNEALTIDGGTLSVAAASQCNAAFKLNSGAISGDGILSLSGAVVWSGGAMIGTGTTLLPTGSSLSINGAVTHVLNRSLQVQSTTNWTAGDLQFISGAFINDGTFNASTETGLGAYGQSGSNVFVNNGTFNKSGGGLAQFYLYNTGLGFNNNGAVNVNAGTLDLSGFGVSSTPMTIVAGATLSFGRDYTFSSATADINGSGSLAVYGGSLALDNSFSVESANVLLSGGAISGAGTVTFAGSFTWSGGGMFGNGTTVLPTGSSLIITGPVTHVLARTVQVSSTTNWTAGDLQFISGTFINNGTFAASTESALYAYGQSGSNVFVNNGSFNKSGAGLMQFYLYNTGLAFNNNGALNINTGQFDLSGFGTSTTAMSITAGATLSIGRDYLFSGAAADINGAGTLAINSGTLVLDSSFSIESNNVVLSGGAIGGAGTSTFNGAFTWSGGGMFGNGTTLLPTGSSLSITGATTHVLGRTLQVQSATNWGAGDLQFISGTFINNGVFTASTVTSLGAYGQSGGNVFINNGTFNKADGGLAQFYLYNTGLVFNNNGAVNINAGQLDLSGFGTSTTGMTITAGATLSFGRDYTFSGAAADINGAGTLAVNSGTLVLDNSFSIESNNVVLSGGAIGGSGTSSFNGALTWSGGSMVGNGTTLFPNGSSLSIIGAVTHVLSRTLQVQSVANWTAGDLQFISGTFINNGTFNASTETGLNAYGQAGGNVFVNNGTFDKSGGGLTQFYLYNTGLAFNNNGAANINAGQLDLSGFGTSASAMTIAAGATLSFGRDYTFAGSMSDINGAGTLAISGGTLTFDHSFAVESATVLLTGGAISGTGTTTFNGALIWSGGGMYGTGTTLMPAGSLLTINAAATHVLSRTLQANSTTNWAAGDLQFISGTLINNGIFNASTESALYAYGQAGSNVFVNNGYFNKNGGGSAQFYVYNTGVPFNNNGAVNINAGTLSLDSGGTSTTSFTIAAGATLAFRGGTTYSFAAGAGANLNRSGAAGGADINGPGTLVIGGGTLSLEDSFTVESTNVQLSGGTLSGSATTTFTGTLTWSSGSMIGLGRTVIAAGGTLSINGAATEQATRSVDNDGTVNVAQGTLVLNGQGIHSGDFSISSGSSLILNGDQTLGPTSEISGAGTLHCAGGTIIHEGDVHITGTAVFAGGNETFNAPFTSNSIDLQNGANVSFNGATTTGGGTLSGGTLSGSGDVTVTGTLVWTGGLMSGDGTTTIASGAKLNLVGAGVRDADRTLEINGTASLAAAGNQVLVAKSVVVAPTGIVNMADNVVIVDYPASLRGLTTVSPAGNAIRALLTSGYNGGAWNGNGINSSVAAMTPGAAVGWAESADLFTSFPASFGGQNVDSTSVLIRYTLYGDSNLDRKVDLTDFTYLAANFNGANKRWSQGDYNYDGKVDLTDFTFLASNFNSTVSAPPPAIQSVQSVPLAGALAPQWLSSKDLAEGSADRARVIDVIDEC